MDAGNLFLYRNVLVKRLALILLLMLPVLSGCRRESFTPQAPVAVETSEMGIYVSAPGGEGSKADVGDVPSSEAEYTLHELMLWVFTSEGHEKVATLSLGEGKLPLVGQTRRYGVTVSREFARHRPDVDVFVVGNGTSIGCTLDENSTWNEVNDAVFSGTYFSVAYPVRQITAHRGLPMTGVGRGLSVTGEEPALRVETVALKRAVSKIRYVFCRMYDPDGNDNVAINRIVLNGNLIPQSEYLFTASLPYAIGPGGYIIDQLVTEGPATLAQNEAPEKLAYAGQDAVSYQNLLDKAVADGVLTDAGVIYLRESDKMLTGFVEYTINGVTSTKTFSMAAPGDFARNHSWTLYGYFIGGRNIQMAIFVQPWDYNTFSVDFSDQSVQATQFVVDDTTADVVETSHDHFDVRLRAGTTCKGHFNITTPVSGKILIHPIGDASSFIVTPDIADINPENSAGRIDVDIRRNPMAEGNQTGKYITLGFTVEAGDREIDADSEILNGKVYRFLL